MDIQNIRRARLADWLKTHTVPSKEKSLFSQLKSGGSFGERVARRIEADYGMGAGYLDRSIESDSANTGHNRPLSDEAKMLIEWVERFDGLGDPARKIFSGFVAVLQVADSLQQSQNPDVGSAVENIEAAIRLLEGVNPTEQSRSHNHESSKHRSKR